jgi:SAM-dependent methyltransferase
MTMLGGSLLGRQPHYVREYRNLVRFLARRSRSEHELAERAVGGDYEGSGALQAKLVLDCAPPGPFVLIDVGCGSGRAASALRNVERLQYLGTDVVPSLLDFARTRARRPDWRFVEVTSLDIPAAPSSADIVLFMSVFTHLRASEVTHLIREAARVLKPGGVVICSYLDRTNSGHVGIFRPQWRQTIARVLGRDVMISFTTEPELTARLEDGGFRVEQSLKEANLGQYVLIARKKD